MDVEKLIQKAKWVCAFPQMGAPVIRRSFMVKANAGGALAVSALGFFVPYLNGKRIGKDYFRPSNSLFCRRDLSNLIYPNQDEFRYRCYYSIYDITPYLQPGENVLEIALADGWYRQTLRVAEGNMAFGDALGAIYAIALTDGQEILSDGSEGCYIGQLLSAQLFSGEIYDAGAGNTKPQPVAVAELSKTVLTKEIAPADRIVRRIAPKLLCREGERSIYDAGENISGFVTLQINAKKNESVSIRFAERLENGKLDYRSTGSGYKNADGTPQIQQDLFISNGTPQLYEPRFVWHGFRYFEIEGAAEPVSVAVVHSCCPVTAEFSSASPELNWLFEAYIRTQQDNMHGGVPMDCPHRERLGYTGDGQVCAPAAMLLLDSKAFYRKWIWDIFDSQDKKRGHVNHTAPFAGGGGGPGGWGCAAILVPWAYYQQFGDSEPLQTHYRDMGKWISYLQTKMESGLVVREEDGGWCLGDWCTLEKTEIPEAFVNTCYLVRSLRIMEQIATILGKPEDAIWYAALRRQAETALTNTYFDGIGFLNGIQGADALALQAGLGDQATYNRLKDTYDALGHFDTGFLATDALCDLLWHNDPDVAYKLLTSHALGSFGYMMDQGATTLWETWKGGASQNHPMFGACARQLVTALLGITWQNGVLKIAPHIPKDLQWVKGGVLLPIGRVGVSWKRCVGSIAFDIAVPRNVTFTYQQKTYQLTSGRNELTITE